MVEKDKEEKEAKKLKKRKDNRWWKSTIAKYLIYPLIVALIILLLTKFWPEKPPTSEIKTAPIELDFQGETLSKIIKEIEGRTDYNVIANQEVREFKIYGKFQGDNWIQVLKRIINSHDKQLKLEINETNKKIIISLKPPPKPKK
jgi:hypothetical protein